MKTVEIFTDGACFGNPGPGGYGAILKYKDQEKEISDGFARTTNNQMELLAVINALNCLKESCNVTITTDSEYVQNGILYWIRSWKKNNWITKAGKPVQNKELWEALDQLVQRHICKVNWVKGHSGHPENERCDELAKRAASAQRSQANPNANRY